MWGKNRGIEGGSHNQSERTSASSAHDALYRLEEPLAKALENNGLLEESLSADTLSELRELSKDTEIAKQLMTSFFAAATETPGMAVAWGDELDIPRDVMRQAYLMPLEYAIQEIDDQE